MDEERANAMKPGVLMTTLGAGQYDRDDRQSQTDAASTDQQIADIVAYLQSLK